MKKQIIFAAMIIIAFIAQAQYADYYYHRIGDTVEWKAPNGYYQWWDFEQYHSDHRRNEVGHRNSYDLTHSLSATYFFTADTLKVIGIAAVIGYFDRTINQFCDSSEYLLIYDAQPNAKVLLSKTPWHYNLDSCRVLHLSGYTSDGELMRGCEEEPEQRCCGNCEWDQLYCLYEYYFDSAIFLVDSFYMGSTNYSYPTWRAITSGSSFVPFTPGYICSNPMETSRGNPCATTPLWPGSGICSFPPIPIAYMNVDDTPNYPYPETPFRWYHRNAKTMQMIYPIIQVDTTVPPSNVCPPVQNFQLALLEDGCATFTWDDCPNYTGFEVLYSSDSGVVTPETIVSTTDNLFQLCDLDSATSYHFAVRAICDDAKKETDWSTTIRLRLTEPEPVGIPNSALSRHTYISPNPASDILNIHSDFALIQVDVFNTQGTLVYQTAAEGKDYLMNISQWPRGKYFLRITTFHGTTTKLLIKE